MSIILERLDEDLIESLSKGVLITTIPGLEDVTLMEIQRILHRKLKHILRPYDLGGRLIILEGLSKSEIQKVILNARTIEHIYLLLDYENLGDKAYSLEQIRNYLSKIPFDTFITPFERIAVRSEREGTHNFTSIDIARVCGDVILRKVRAKYGIRPAVDLTHPSMIIFVDLAYDSIFVGLDLTHGRTLAEREYRRYIHPAMLRPTIASSMILLAEKYYPNKPQTLLDPMCGAGTILIEAGYLNGNLTLIGGDINPEFIRGAYENYKASVLNKSNVKFLLYVGDVANVSKTITVDVDMIITDPPYGIRMKPKELRAIYNALFREAAKILAPNGILEVITIRKTMSTRFGREYGFKLLHERRIFQGGLYSHILLFKA